MKNKKQDKSQFSLVVAFLYLSVSAFIFGQYLYIHKGRESFPKVSSPFMTDESVKESLGLFSSLSNHEGSASSFMWLMLLILSFWSVRLFITVLRKVEIKKNKGFLISRFFLLASIFLLTYAEYLAKGKPFLAIGPLLPAGELSRFFNLDISMWLRRLIDPAVWFYILLILGISITSKPFKKVSKYYILSSLALFFYLLVQVFCMLPFMQKVSIENLEGFTYVIYFLGQAFIILLIDAIGREIFYLKKKENFKKNDLKVIFPSFMLIGAFLVFMLVMGFSFKEEPTKKGLEFLVESSTINKETLEKEERKVKKENISYFVFNWFPNSKEEERKALFSVLSGNESKLEDLKFLINYQSTDIDRKDLSPMMLKADLEFERENKIIFLTPDRVFNMKEHFRRIAKFYMKNPSYLRINNRPVLFIDKSNRFVGDVSLVLEEVIDYVREKEGVTLFLVFDARNLKSIKEINQRNLLAFNGAFVDSKNKEFNKLLKKSLITSSMIYMEVGN